MGWTDSLGRPHSRDRCFGDRATCRITFESSQTQVDGHEIFSYRSVTGGPRSPRHDRYFNRDLGLSVQLVLRFLQEPLAIDMFFLGIWSTFGPWILMQSARWASGFTPVQFGFAGLLLSLALMSYIIGGSSAEVWAIF